MADKRIGTGFLIRQRAYLKLFILTKIGENRVYGQQIYDELTNEFRAFNYKPYNSEIYRALQELMEGGYVKRQRVKVRGTSYQEIYLYYIHDPDKVNAYRKLLKADLDRCIGMLRYAVEKNYQ